MENLKIILSWSPIFILLILFFYNLPDSSHTTYHYEVEVTYCDDRPVKKIIVLWNKRTRPTSYDIKTKKQATPRFEGEINVCDIRTIREVK